MFNYVATVSNKLLKFHNRYSISKNMIKNGTKIIAHSYFQDMLSKSPDTAGHCKRVMLISCQIGNALNLSQENMRKLQLASLLHDFGKVYISNKVLNKIGSLEKDEYEIIKTHCMKGYQELSKNQKLSEIAEIILYHHERYNGSGYPTGKKGTSIPILSRIITAADAYDAMTSIRNYKRQLSTEEAIGELNNGRSVQFDDHIVDVLIRLIDNEEINCLQ